MLRQPCNAAGAVATLLGFAAIGIIDDVVKVSVWLFWGRDHQQLVETDTLVTLRPAFNHCGRNDALMGYCIQYHEVITKACIL